MSASSWEWLLALRRKLGVDLEIVDAGQSPLLNSAPAADAAAIRDLLAAGGPGIRTALTTALQTGAAQTLSLEAAHLAFVPLTIEKNVAGALVLAQQRTASVPAERAHGALELMGVWLSTAIEAHLITAWSEEGDLDRLSALYRLLGDPATQRTDRDIIAAFAEALAIWHDLDVYAYLEAASGDLVLEVSLAGVEPDQNPGTIPRTAVPESGGLARVSRLDLERMGFSGDRDAVMSRLSDKAGAWVIFVRGAISSGDVARLGRYISALEQSVTRALNTSLSRVVASIARRLLDDGRSSEERVQRALGVLLESLGATAARLTLGNTDASRVFDAEVGAAGLPEIPTAGQRFSVVRSLPRGYEMTVDVRWSGERRVGRQGEQEIRAAADLFESWSRQRLSRSPESHERRAAGRSYEDELEQFAARAVESGVPVTAVVISFADTSLAPGILQASVSKLRDHVRSSDLVGRLGAREIGMLLHDVEGSGAEAVTNRVRQALNDASIGEPAPVTVGYASRAPGMAEAPLAQRAREEARRAVGSPEVPRTT